MADHHNPITRQQYLDHDLRAAVFVLSNPADIVDDQRPLIEHVHRAAADLLGVDDDAARYDPATHVLVRRDDFDQLAEPLDYRQRDGLIVQRARNLVDHARADHDAARQHDKLAARIYERLGDHDVITWDDLPDDVRDAIGAAYRCRIDRDHRRPLVNLARALNNAGFGTDDQRTDDQRTDDDVRRLRDEYIDAAARVGAAVAYGSPPVVKAARALVAALDR